MTRSKPPKHEARRLAEKHGRKPLPTHGAPHSVSLTVAAGYLGVHTSTLHRWIKSGRLKADGGQVEMAEVARVRELLTTEEK